MERSLYVVKNSVLVKVDTKKRHTLFSPNIQTINRLTIKPKQKTQKQSFAFGHSEIKKKIANQSKNEVKKLNPETNFGRIGSKILSESAVTTMTSKAQSQAQTMSVTTIQLINQVNVMSTSKNDNQSFKKFDFINQPYKDWPLWKIPFENPNYENVKRNSEQAYDMIRNYYLKHPEEIPSSDKMFSDFKSPHSPATYLSSRDLIYCLKYVEQDLKIKIKSKSKQERLHQFYQKNPQLNRSNPIASTVKNKNS